MSSYIFHISLSDLVLLGAAFIAIGFFYPLWLAGKVKTNDGTGLVKRFFINFSLLSVLWIAYLLAAHFYSGHLIGIRDGEPLMVFFLIGMILVATNLFTKPSTKPERSVGQTVAIPEDLAEKGVWLKNAMEAGLYYHDPDLSIISLAAALGIPARDLSRIINTALRKNFHDFVNEYRMREVMRKMADPAYNHINLLGLALDAGFNSKSTFNRIFREMTGKSPMQYKAGLKKDDPSRVLRRYSPIPALISNHATALKWSQEKLNRNFMFRNYLKIAFRNFWKHKLFTLINVIGLSIGISAALVIYLLVHYDLTFDKFHKDGERIYRVVTNFTVAGSPWSRSGVCGPLPFATKNQVTGLQEAAPIFMLAQPNVTVPNGDKSSSRFKLQDNVVVTDSDYFKLFEYKWLAGSAKAALTAPYQVVLTSAQAEKYFPGLSYDQMLGRTVVYDTLKTTVSGIVQSIKQNTDFTFHDFISFPTAFSNPSLKMQLRLHNWGGVSTSYQLFVKLAPQVTNGTH